MKPDIKIAIIGGTGKAGKYLVDLLINRGYHIKALVRNPEHFAIHHDQAEIVTGNAAEYNAVLSVVTGCNVVISTLGMGNPPSEPTIFSTATNNILNAMKQTGITRYIVITGLNVDTPFDRKGKTAKAGTAWMYANYPVSTRDKQHEYELLSESDANWTLIRLPMIEQMDSEAEIIVSLTDCPGTAISATSLANFLTGQITDETYIKQAPFIANE